MKYFLLSALTFIIVTNLNAQIIPDSTAIKQLLEKESASWRSGDVKAHSSCWFIQPYSRILVSTPEGKCYDVPPKSMLQSSESMGEGGHAEISNLRFSIHGTTAWVSHDERSFARDGTITLSHEIRILEKIKGQWKLVGQSIHLYRP
jgi:hypothetical protein